MFDNPIKSTVKKSEKKSPFDYTQPPYDERSSCYVNTGSHFGVGFNNPVGHLGASKMRVDTLPFGRISTLQTDDVPRSNLKPEFLR